MEGPVQLEFDDASFRPVNEPAARDHTRVPKALNPKAKKVPRKSGGGRRSLKEPVSKEIELPPDEELFKRTYYSIGEVAEMFGEQTSLIRYWTKEFKILKPRKNRKGDRYYRPVDVKSIYLIYHLLRDRKFTIEGAREYLKNAKSATRKLELIESLEKLKLFLQQLKDNL